jgi:hypothetical protein
VDAIATLWLSCLSVVGGVHGKNSLRIAVLPAEKGGADADVGQWLTDILVLVPVRLDSRTSL